MALRSIQGMLDEVCQQVKDLSNIVLILSLAELTCPASIRYISCFWNKPHNHVHRYNNKIGSWIYGKLLLVTLRSSKQFGRQTILSFAQNSYRLFHSTFWYQKCNVDLAVHTLCLALHVWRLWRLPRGYMPNIINTVLPWQRILVKFNKLCK